MFFVLGPDAEAAAEVEEIVAVGMVLVVVGVEAATTAEAAAATAFAFTFAPPSAALNASAASYPFKLAAALWPCAHASVASALALHLSASC